MNRGRGMTVQRIRDGALRGRPARPARVRAEDRWHDDGQQRDPTGQQSHDRYPPVHPFPPHRLHDPAAAFVHKVRLGEPISLTGESGGRRRSSSGVTTSERTASSSPKEDASRETSQRRYLNRA